MSRNATWDQCPVCGVSDPAFCDIQQHLVAVEAQIVADRELTESLAIVAGTAVDIRQRVAEGETIITAAATLQNLKRRMEA